MKRLLICLALMASDAAFAQSNAMSQQDCEASWALMAEGLDSVSTARPRSATGGFCTVTDISARDGDRVIRFDRIDWRGADINRLFENGLPPTDMDVRLKGLMLEGPWLGWLDGFLPVDLDITARWDEAHKEVVLEQLRLVLPEDRRIAVAGTVIGADLSSEAAIASSMGTARLTTLSFDLQSNDLVSAALHGVFGTADPAAIDDIPRSLMGSSDQRVLKRGLSGELDQIAVEIESDGGISILQLVAGASADGSIASFADRFPDLRISVR